MLFIKLNKDPLRICAPLDQIVWVSISCFALFPGATSFKSLSTCPESPLLTIDERVVFYFFLIHISYSSGRTDTVAINGAKITQARPG